MDKDIEGLAKACMSCQAHKHTPPPATLHPWTWPPKPWRRIHVDFAGPFLGTSFLVVVDAHSKWPEVFEMTSTSTTKTIATLRHLFAAYGLPEQVVSDNGPQFISEEFATFLKKNGVRHIRCAPYHPSSNGAVERFIQTFKQSMRASENDGRSLSHRLANFLLSYRATPHATTNRSPASLFLNRTLRTRFSLLYPDTERHVLDKQADQVRQHDQHAKTREFDIGQQVMARNVRQSRPKWIPATILKKTGPISYIVKTNSGLDWKRHVDHIRAYQPRNTQVTTPSPNDTDDFDTPTLHEPGTTEQNESTETSTTTARRYPARERAEPDRLMQTF